MLNINQKILMSDAKSFDNTQQINPYYHQESINRDQAIAEHNNIRDLLVSAGVDVVSVTSPSGCQDGVYTANWALVRGDTAVMSNLPNARQGEQNHAEKILSDMGKTIAHVPEGLKFSGQGDALACGDLLFCGCGYRSDEAAQKFAADTLGYARIQLQTNPELDESGNPMTNQASGWPDSFFYDIDLALAVIKAPTGGQKGLIAYCPEAFTPASRDFLAAFDMVDKIEVSVDEAQHGFATNLISTGETVIMSAHAPKLANELRNHGLNVLTPEIAELAKGGGYIRCITLSI